MSAPTLIDLLAPGGRFIHLIGGGGKTTLMFALAREAVAAGCTVLTTTSTRIWRPRPGQSPCVVLGERSSGELRALLAHHRQVTAAASEEPGTGKLVGFSAARLSALHAAHAADLIVVEADGSAGRPLKMHADHEPVIAPDTDRVIVVVGADAIGARLSDETVHRAALCAARLGAAPGAVMDPELVARLVVDHLARVPPGAGVTVVLGRVREPDAVARAQAVADSLLLVGRIGQVVVGDLARGEVLLRRPDRLRDPVFDDPSTS